MEMTIGANIKRLRMAKGITQEQLSSAMNVTCAAVSKWERSETYPDITLLQPLAYYFGVSLDELMGYNQEKIQAEIDDAITLYLSYWKKNDWKKAQETIAQAYRDYPNDYRIMHYYMWDIGGGWADNNPEVLISHKDEFLAICDKILEGCTEEGLRLNAWNMRAKILHAQGDTDKAMEIYKTKFASWYHTCGQKAEQLFAKDTKEYYFQVQKNMYELADFAADKLGRTVFFNPSLSMSEKTKSALKYGGMLLNIFDETGEDFFLAIAVSFLGRMENDLTYRGGADDEVISVMDKHLYAAKLITERLNLNEPLYRAYYDIHRDAAQSGYFEWILNYHFNAKDGRRAQLLNNADYVDVLNKYRKVRSKWLLRFAACSLIIL